MSACWHLGSLMAIFCCGMSGPTATAFQEDFRARNLGSQTFDQFRITWRKDHKDVSGE